MSQVWFQNQRSLGETALGLNSLFNSILSAISIADVGLDTVLLFVLIKPLDTKNYFKLYSLVSFIRKLYFSVAGIILVAGLCIIPFLSTIINGTHVTPYIVLIFLLYLLNAVLTYCFAEYRVLLNANQQSYVVSIITFLVTSSMTIAQIISLNVFNSFLIFEIIQILATLLMGVLMYLYVARHIKLTKNNDTISSNDKKIIFKNGIGGLSNRIGSFVVFSSDSVLLSIFTNLITVARYSNYMMLVNAVVSIILKALSAMMPSIGHLVLTQNDDEKSNFFEIFNHSIYLMSFAVFGFFLFNADYFIAVWLGQQLMFSKLTTLLIAVNMLIRIARLGSLNYIDALGLQWNQRWKPVIEAVVNLTISIIMLSVFKLGINGVLLATLFSNITTVIWMEPRVVFQNGVTFRKEFIYIVIRFLTLIVGTIIYFLLFYQAPYNTTILGLLINFLIYALYIVILVFVEFFTSVHGRLFIKKFVIERYNK